jgi:hypothetical protein
MWPPIQSDIHATCQRRRYWDQLEPAERQHAEKEPASHDPALVIGLELVDYRPEPVHEPVPDDAKSADGDASKAGHARRFMETLRHPERGQQPRNASDVKPARQAAHAINLVPF